MSLALADLNYTYKDCLIASQKVCWTVEEVIKNRNLDFTKPFIPESLAMTDRISCLNSQEKMTLNHIRGKTYAYLFRFVEEFIIPQVIDQAASVKHKHSEQLWSLLRFAEEEMKHQELFSTVETIFQKDFSSDVTLASDPSAVAKVVLSKSSTSVLMLTCMLEWMTQKHYMDSFRSQEKKIDPVFEDVFKYHWLEECQHARIDTLELFNEAKEISLEKREHAVDEMIEILTAFDQILLEQVELDIRSLERSLNKNFSEIEKKEIRHHQQNSYRWTFFISGLEHKKFQHILQSLTVNGVKKIEKFMMNYKN
ncbi:MAG: hypothetical protein CMP11_08820 [Zetaproteobacteria bacterium]|nr:hypothetical protein [Pseudobdellovibrionaceae bacterium]